MTYIVLDLEWNQPFSVKMMIKEPLLLHGEIIQIGAVKLDENFQPTDTFKILVAPKYYRKMHKKVSALTQITTDKLQYGFQFKVALKHFKRWCGEDFAFLTWGPDDISMLRDNMSIHKINTDWLPDTYDLQIIFDSQITKTNHQISLTYAMEAVKETARTAHDALNDALNTAQLCQHLDMSEGIREYETLTKEFNKSDSLIIDRCKNEKSYQTKEEALKDSALTEFYCPECGKRAVCVDFIKQNTDKYICLGKCEDGEKFFVRFKFTRRADRTFAVTRIIYEMSKENECYYQMKKKQSEAPYELYTAHIETAV